MESLLLSISGRDQRGLLARLTEHLYKLGVQISDIGQAVIHDELALAMIIHTDQKKTLDLAIRDVCERLDVRFELAETEVRQISEVSSFNENSLILTLMTRGRSASALHSVSRLAFDQDLRFGIKSNVHRSLSLNLEISTEQDALYLADLRRFRGDRQFESDSQFSNLVARQAFLDKNKDCMKLVSTHVEELTLSN